MLLIAIIYDEIVPISIFHVMSRLEQLWR